jgi:hypothetical protein
VQEQRLTTDSGSGRGFLEGGSEGVSGLAAATGGIFGASGVAEEAVGRAGDRAIKRSGLGQCAAWPKLLQHPIRHTSPLIDEAQFDVRLGAAVEVGAVADDEAEIADERFTP